MNFVKILRTPTIDKFLTDALEKIDDRTSTLAKQIENLLQTTSSKYVPASILSDAYKIADKTLYFHELISGCDLFVPAYVAPERNPELDARVERLKAEQAEREYKEMVKNVDLNQRYTDRTNTSFLPDMKSIQGQIISILNVFLTILGAFVFGYKAVEYSIGTKDFTLQLTAGLICAFIVAIADIYFLLKRLSKIE